MNFVKLLFVLSFSLLAYAETPFNVTAAPGEIPTKPGKESEVDMVGFLKQKAVQNWMQRNLGDRYASMENQITVDFAERYILNYKLGRSATNNELLELSGYLDEESLRKWVRLTETKGGKGPQQIRPLFLVSASLPGLSLRASDSLDTIREAALGRAAMALLNQGFQKLNLRAIPATGNFSFSSPPIDERGTIALREAAGREGANTAVWLNLTTCQGCESPRADLYLYSFINPRLVSVQSDDILLGSSDYQNAEKLQELLKSVFRQFHEDFEATIAENRLSTVPLTVRVEGVESYRLYKLIEAAFGKVDFLRQARPKSFSSKVAEFEGLSDLSTEELARRVQSLSLASGALKTVRIDSRGVVMRYLP